MKMKRFCFYKTLAFVNAHVSGNSARGEARSYLSLQPTILSPVSAIPLSSPVLLCVLQYRAFMKHLQQYSVSRAQRKQTRIFVT